MQTWIQNHWTALLLLVGGGGSLIFWFRKPALLLWHSYWKAKAELQASTERLADGYQKETTLVERQRNSAREECQRLEAVITELKDDLYDSVRQLDLRMDLNRQDVAKKRVLRRTIRGLRTQAHALRVLLQKHSIEDSEIADVPRQEEEIDEDQIYPLH